MEHLGLVAYRIQEKRRHTFKFDEVTVDVDTWPTIPPYAELEGPSEDAVKKTAQQLGFDYQQAVFGNAGKTIERFYHIQLAEIRFFTFEKIQ